MFDIMQIVLGATGYFFNWIPGHLYANYDPSAFIYYGMGCGYVVLVVLVVLQTVATCLATKDAKDDVTEEISRPSQDVYQSVKTDVDGITEM